MNKYLIKIKANNGATECITINGDSTRPFQIAHNLWNYLYPGYASHKLNNIAKKNPKDYQAFETQFWKDVEERGSDRKLCEYVWNVLVASQRGYSLTKKVKAIALEIACKIKTVNCGKVS